MTDSKWITDSTWIKTLCHVRDEMSQFVRGSVTPISRSSDQVWGEAEGTGNYVSLRGSPYLLTNEHVARTCQKAFLAHLPGPTDDYVFVEHPFATVAWPTDIAITRLPSAPSRPDRKILPTALLDSHFCPTEDELFFWLGYPGTTGERHDPVTEGNTRRTVFGTLSTPGIPVLVQAPREAVTDLPGFKSEFHVALHYPASAVKSLEELMAAVPNPKGMSGSLLWDTKFAASRTAGEKWDVNKARVCGVIWAAHANPEVVVATKIEHVRVALMHLLRHESAYFRWLSRGSPLWDAMADWGLAKQEIQDLGS